MWSLVVVTIAPIFGHSTHLIEIHKDITVEDLSTECPIETFDISILCRFAGLDVNQFDTLLLCLVFQCSAHEFGAIIQP